MNHYCECCGHTGSDHPDGLQCYAIEPTAVGGESCFCTGFERDPDE